MNIDLVHQWSLGGEADTGFHGMSQMDTDLNGNLYVVDGAHTLSKFDASGNFIERVGRQGGGPGEFEGVPVDLVVHKDTISVIEAEGRALHRFDESLNFIDRITLPETSRSPISVVTNHQGSYYVTSFDIVAENRFVRYDPLLANARTVELNRARNHFHWDFLKATSDEQGRVIAAYVKAGFVEIFDAAGNTISTFQADHGPSLPDIPEFDPQRDPGEQLRDGPIPETFIWDVGANGDRIFLLMGDYAANPDREIYMYDYDGNLVGSAQLDHDATRLHVDREGFLYVYYTHLAELRKYEVTAAS